MSENTALFLLSFVVSALLVLVAIVAWRIIKG